MPRVLTLSFVQTIFVKLGLLFFGAIRGDSEKQGVKLPGGKDGEYIYTKLCMFADDTQLFNKNDESVKISFDILTYPPTPLLPGQMSFADPKI
jgi:hypothetical protein